MFSVDIFKISETPKKTGLLSFITHEIGDKEISQSENLYKASIVFSIDTPGGSVINISTFSAVLSSTFFIFIFPLSLAFKILVMRLPLFTE